MADLYSLDHREAGTVSTFLTREEAEAELAAVLEDEPDWRPDLWVEPFEFVVGASARPHGCTAPGRRH